MAECIQALYEVDSLKTLNQLVRGDIDLENAMTRIEYHGALMRQLT